MGNKLLLARIIKPMIEVKNNHGEAIFIGSVYSVQLYIDEFSVKAFCNLT
jgi:hypothetical protein